jgi:hypothetical protein
VIHLFCRHRYWIPTNVLKSELPDKSLIISWTTMACGRCGKVRNHGALKPREAVVLPIDEMITEVTNG